jgi:hypothetical protein
MKVHMLQRIHETICDLRMLYGAEIWGTHAGGGGWKQWTGYRGDSARKC